jgi:hypothetical protein
MICSANRSQAQADYEHIACCGTLLLIARTASWCATARARAFDGGCAWKISRRVSCGEKSNEDATATLKA